ncbi:MAG: ABC transporter permease [Actinomycetes bacterium]
MATGTFTPAPAAAPLTHQVLAHAGHELRLQLRNGEQLLLTVVIPILVLVGGVHVPLGTGGSGTRIGFLAPGVISLAVLSTAFTGQAIGTGFERRYGVLKRMGASPLPRSGLLAGKTLAVLVIEAGQVVVLSGIAVALGWRPHPVIGSALLVLILGTAAFSAIALLRAGTLRAEATRAGANLVFLLLLGLGGIAIPLTKFPAGVRAVLDLTPSAALSNGLRDTLTHGSALPAVPLVVLAIWTLVAGTLTARTFRWE